MKTLTRVLLVLAIAASTISCSSQSSTPVPEPLISVTESAPPYQQSKSPGAELDQMLRDINAKVPDAVKIGNNAVRIYHDTQYDPLMNLPNGQGLLDAVLNNAYTGFNSPTTRLILPRTYDPRSVRANCIGGKGNSYSGLPLVAEENSIYSQYLTAINPFKATGGIPPEADSSWTQLSVSDLDKLWTICESIDLPNFENDIIDRTDDKVYVSLLEGLQHYFDVENRFWNKQSEIQTKVNEINNIWNTTVTAQVEMNGQFTTYSLPLSQFYVEFEKFEQEMFQFGFNNPMLSRENFESSTQYQNYLRMKTGMDPLMNQLFGPETSWVNYNFRHGVFTQDVPIEQHTNFDWALNLRQERQVKGLLLNSLSSSVAEDYRNIPSGMYHDLANLTLEKEILKHSLNGEGTGNDVTSSTVLLFGPGTFYNYNYVPTGNPPNYETGEFTGAVAITYGNGYFGKFLEASTQSLAPIYELSSLIAASQFSTDITQMKRDEILEAKAIFDQVNMMIITYNQSMTALGASQYVPSAEFTRLYEQINSLALQYQQ